MPFRSQGLPVSVTLSLLLIAVRMKRSRVLVKNLTVIETLSCVNVIASDKTGTLTQNKMFVASASVGVEQVSLDEAAGKDFEPTLGFTQLVSSAGLCNNAQFDADEDASVPVKQRKVKGDATDTALLRFSAEYERYQNLNKSYDIEAEIPFNSRNKWMVKVIRARNPEMHAQIFGADAEYNANICLLKGAPDYLLKKSAYVIRSDGTQVPITPDINSRIIGIQNDLCLLGQRVLLICKKEFRLDDDVYAYGKGAEASAASASVAAAAAAASTSEGGASAGCGGDLEKYVQQSNDFCIIGLVGIIDPPREGISDVLAKCKTAGIRVFMVTGDYALTAAAIATQIGILTQPQYDTVETMRIKHKENNESYEASSLLLTGNDLDTLSDADWRMVTPYKEIVFARTTPEQKLKTVKGRVSI